MVKGANSVVFVLLMEQILHHPGIVAQMQCLPAVRLVVKQAFLHQLWQAAKEAKAQAVVRVEAVCWGPFPCPEPSVMSDKVASTSYAAAITVYALAMHSVMRVAPRCLKSAGCASHYFPEVLVDAVARSSER